MIEHCTRHLRKGVKKPAEYILEGGLCETCWIDWWIEGLHIENPRERAKVRRDVRATLRKRRKRKGDMAG